MEIHQLHHVAIIVSDYQRSKHFYTQILGCEIIRENYREERDSYKLDLKTGNSQLELFSFPAPPERLTQPEAAGLRHICFSVKDIHAAVRELNQKGIETEPVRYDEYTGSAFTFFRDPDELPIELYEISG